MPDGVQKLTLFQWVDDVRTRVGEARAQRVAILDEPREPARIDARLALVAPEHAGVTLELLDHVGAHVASAQDRDDLEQARDRGARAEVARIFGVKKRLLVEELDPQEGPHPL